MRTPPRIQQQLDQHTAQLLQCRRCPNMQSTPVSGGSVLSKVMIVGQAPGPREPLLKKPFAHTAGKTLFQWFYAFCHLTEAQMRSRIYFAAVCRCFPGKTASGGDRVPTLEEVQNCVSWMDAEIRLLKPDLIIPIGKLAITQFVSHARLDEVIGRTFRKSRNRHRFDVIPLPHPSGASPWHRIPPGAGLLRVAMQRIARHPAMGNLLTEHRPRAGAISTLDVGR